MCYLHITADKLPRLGRSYRFLVPAAKQSRQLTTQMSHGQNDSFPHENIGKLVSRLVSQKFRACPPCPSQMDHRQTTSNLWPNLNDWYISLGGERRERERETSQIEQVVRCLHVNLGKVKQTGKGFSDSWHLIGISLGYSLT